MMDKEKIRKNVKSNIRRIKGTIQEKSWLTYKLEAEMEVLSAEKQNWMDLLDKIDKDKKE